MRRGEGAVAQATATRFSRSDLNRELRLAWAPVFRNGMSKSQCQIESTHIAGDMM
jgi:hypothetical protein